MKQKWMWLNELWQDSPKLSRVAFWLLLVIGLGFLITSFFLPPQGEINKTVLQAFGMVQSFASLGVGFSCISEGMSMKMQHGSTTIEFSQEDKDD